MKGFLLVDKASGWTSHDVVAKVRSTIGIKKVGHAGTLDPMATGLLVLGLGRATRLLRYVQGLQKEYIATAAFGVATDSLDADGEVIDRAPLPVTPDDVEAVLHRFRGRIHQVPPMVSARKVDGRRLYELAREGEEVEREARPVTVYSLDLLDVAPSDYPEVSFRVRCSTGTYVRTLADDIARALGGRAHLIALRRTANGSLHVDDAHDMDAVAAAADEGRIDEVIMSPAAALADLPAITVDEGFAGAVANGRPVPLIAGRDASPEDPVRILDPDGDLLAVYRVEEARLRAEVVIG